MNTDDENYWREPMLCFTRISGWIIGPAIVAFFLGELLDGKLKSQQYIFFPVLLAAFAISVFKMLKESTEYVKRTQDNKNSTPKEPHD